MYRAEIRKELRKRDLEDFAIHHHRLIWAAINEIEETTLGLDVIEALGLGDDDLGDQLSLIDLPRLLADRINLDDSDGIASRLTPLLKPTEVQLAAMNQPMLQLRGAASALERQKSIKRCRHLLDAWGGQRLETLESCISTLIDEEKSSPDQSFDMEKRIDNMFKELNTDALHFQELYYSERKHILYLDKQRCSGFIETQTVSA